MIRRISLISLAMVLMAGTASAVSAPPVSTPPASTPPASTPHVSATTLPTPLPLPYDEAADAHAALGAAIVRAKAGHKYVFLDLGGNWCPDCRVLAGVMGLKELRPTLTRTFEVVTVDVGRMDKNLDIAAQYGITVKAVPTVIILDADGHFVNSGTPTALSDARSMSPQAIVDTIYGWISAAR